jgi:hypothetical protein
MVSAAGAMLLVVSSRSQAHELPPVAATKLAMILVFFLSKGGGLAQVIRVGTRAQATVSTAAAMRAVNARSQAQVFSKSAAIKLAMILVFFLSKGGGLAQVIRVGTRGKSDEGEEGNARE